MTAENIVVNIFVLFVTLICLIGFHEWGHCWTAKRLGIPVARFSLGFGKPIWTKKASDGTEYVICLLPLGGYVQFQDQALFDKSSIMKRFLVYASGPLCNLIFAFLAYWLIFVIGITQVIPRIETVLPNSPAAKSGVVPDSEIIAVDHHPTPTWTAVIFRLIPHLVKKNQASTTQIMLTTTTKPQGIKNYTISVPQFFLNPLKPDLLRSLGLLATTTKEKYQRRLRQFSPLQAIPAALSEIGNYLAYNSIILGKLLTGVIPLQSLAGPVSLFSGTLIAAHHGGIVYIAFLGFMSVNLAFMNLLPIPGLDGASIFYLIIEAIRGKPLTTAFQVLLFKLGMILLSVLIFQACMNDLVRLVSTG